MAENTNSVLTPYSSGVDQQILESNEQNIQAGKGTLYPDEKCERRVCMRRKSTKEENCDYTVLVEEKSKRKVCKRRKSTKEENCECTVFVDPEDKCLQHSYCVIQTMKKKGVIPLEPKGLPWSSGRLLYLPGQRPKFFKKTKKEEAALKIKKKKKLSQIRKKKKRIMKELREGDHKKLCHVVNTSQELMLLMRIISIVMEKKKAERKLRLAEMQTEIETITEDDEGDEEEEEEVDVEAVEEAKEKDQEGEPGSASEAPSKAAEEERLPDNFLEE